MELHIHNSSFRKYFFEQVWYFFREEDFKTTPADDDYKQRFDPKSSIDAKLRLAKV